MMVVKGPISFEFKKISDKKINEIKSIDGVKDAWGDVIGICSIYKTWP